MPDKVLYTAEATSSGDGRNGIPGADREQIRELAEAAHERCPYSRATRGNISVEVRVP
jgi:organic hydroperoxide reductase OsmC/OhrA